MIWCWGYSAWGERTVNRPTGHPKVDRDKVKASRRANKRRRQR